MSNCSTGETYLSQDMYFKNRLGLWSAIEIEKNWKLFLNFFKNLNDISFEQYLFADHNNFVSI